MQRERLTDEYTAALNMFQATQREALRKESMQVKLKRAAVNSSTKGLPPPPSSDPFRGDEWKIFIFKFLVLSLFSFSILFKMNFTRIN